ncbi:AAA family ATPase [Marinicella meishanensis]|uniref:AAA family ATPase n=1 Tax=Marinicella meishanensis TaxID=2873263 RepID=UPI001CBB404D|nr:AAA family ATPase [Marinicella sp. NBU2979]
MNPDTSIKRIVLFVVLSVLTLPYIMHFFASSGRLYYNQSDMEIEAIMFEVKGFAKLINQWQNSNNRWPTSFADMSDMFKTSGHLSLDLSVENQITATISDQVLTEALRGHQVVFKRHLGWHCDPLETTLPEDFKPIECGGQYNAYITQNNPPNESTFQAVAFIAVVGILIAWVFYHPSIRRLRGREFSLAGQHLKDLRHLGLLTQLSGLKQQVLQANDMHAKTWQTLVRFKGLTDRPKVLYLCRAWGARLQAKASPSTWLLKLDPDTPLNVDALYWYVPPKGTAITRINRQLQQLKETQLPVMIWAEDAAYNNHLQVNRSRIKALKVIPSGQQMTQLLVPKLAATCLLDVLVENLPINRLSPFQGRGGVLKNSHFYGRKTILSQLQNNPRSCFLLAGGRQLGKTSILKAYARQLAQSDHHRCCYISLSDDRLVPRLVHHLGINEHQGLTDLLTQFKQLHPQQQLVVLLDEADRFIATQAEQGDALLAEIRTCAEQGLGQFVLAGFWDLYASAVLDYQSPIKNFAQLVTVGPLDPNSARALLRQPLHLLKQRFAHQGLLDEVSMQTGNRANLINLVGECLVDQLSNHPQVIDHQLIQQALHSQPVYDALQGWSNLSRDPQACAIDRCVVYLTFIHGQIDLARVLQHLESAQCTVGPESLKAALHRLRLAHILIKHDDHYRFAVPLFAAQHSVSEAETLLHQELLQLAS